MRENKLTDAELDFISFMAQQKGLAESVIENEYGEIKKKFRFGSSDFRDFAVEIYKMNSLYYREDTLSELIESYKHHALLHLYRFLSYHGINEESKHITNKFLTLVRLLRKGYFRAIKNQLLRLMFRERKDHNNYDFETICNILEKNVVFSNVSTIVDYGCGPAFISFDVAQAIHAKTSKFPEIVLVDIDTLILEFVTFRFKKYGIPFQVVTISENNPYPKLPPHQIAIVTEVFEHVPKPIEVAHNLISSLTPGGILYGSIDDHEPHYLHVSTDLKEVRELFTAAKMQKIGLMLYRKSSTAI